MSDTLYQLRELPTLTSAEGAVLQACLRVNASDSGAHKGSALAVFDGTWQTVVWLRADGLNLDGQAHVDVDLSEGRHWVTLVVRSGWAEVYVDGNLIQSGAVGNPTTAQGVTWGSWTTKDAFAA